MLTRLEISNYALIHQAAVDFPGHLTVVTGETGAGKSIFLEALGLALGRRADSSVVAGSSKKCVVEAEFDISNLELQGFFHQNELEYCETVVLRRELGTDGRSRCLINDSAVSQAVMKQLAEQLVDIHSQHQTLLLNRTGFQLSVLDVFAGSESALAEYQLAFKKLQGLQDELTDLREREAQASKESDYFRFLFSELDDARLEHDSLRKLEEEATSLENAESIRNVLLKAGETLNADEGIVQTLAVVRQQIASIAKHGEKYAGLGERIQAAHIELKELTSDLLATGERLVVDDKRLNELNGRIDRLNRLMKKHGVTDEAALIRTKEELEAKLSGYESLEARISQAEQQQKKARADVMAGGARLSQLRGKAVPALEREVKKLLGSMGMEHAILKIECLSGTEPSPTGLDDVKFVFAANKGAAPSELHKVASGGELSRLMLALKSMLAQRKNLPCVIFDEIDTGVSGEIADKIGNILLHMGERMQVIAITHLPQLASKGKHHLFVYKKDGKNETVSYIRPLDASERITEVAKMLSRGKPSESAISNAKELLSQ